jgi:hypothetical protein
VDVEVAATGDQTRGETRRRRNWRWSLRSWVQDVVRASGRCRHRPTGWRAQLIQIKGNLELREHEKQPLTNHGSLGTPASLMEKSKSGLRCCVRVRGSFFHQSIPRPGRTGIWGRHLAGQPSSPEPVIAGRTAARRRKWPDVHGVTGPQKLGSNTKRELGSGDPGVGKVDGSSRPLFPLGEPHRDPELPGLHVFFC